MNAVEIWVPDPHIEIICRDWDWDSSTNILTGTWADYSTFDIQLVNVSGHDQLLIILVLRSYLSLRVFYYLVLVVSY